MTITKNMALNIQKEICLETLADHLYFPQLITHQQDVV